MNGRDTTETHFYTEGGNEYMEMAGLLYVSESNVKPIDVPIIQSYVGCKWACEMVYNSTSGNRQKDDRDAAIKWFICGV